jgi:hypothetical protein
LIIILYQLYSNGHKALCEAEPRPGAASDQREGRSDAWGWGNF